MLFEIVMLVVILVGFGLTLTARAKEDVDMTRICLGWNTASFIAVVANLTEKLL